MSQDKIPVDDYESTRRVLQRTKALLLDFDGPICSIFASLPANYIAAKLRGMLIERDHPYLPTSITETEDPFSVLHYATTLDTQVAIDIEKALMTYELEAAASAKPTAYSDTLIDRWKSTGRPVGIVSNNSTAAIEYYLTMREISAHIDIIAARQDADVSKLKPHAHLIEYATNGLEVSPPTSLLIGDSTSDMNAASKAGTSFIGFANRSGKIHYFNTSSTACIVTSLKTVANAVQIVK